MSYEKVKRITIKNGQVRVCSACNNIRPLTFITWALGGGKMSLENSLSELAKAVLYGDFQFYNSKENQKWLKATSLTGENWKKYNEYLEAGEYIYNDEKGCFQKIDEEKEKRLMNELIEAIVNNIKLEFNL